MKRQNRRPDARNENREYRDGAMARSRSTETRTYHMRRRSRRAQAVMTMEPRSPMQRLWDDHAVKAGMAVFWTWFVLANWSKFPAALSELAGPLLGS